MIRNLRHAVISVALILVTGWVLAQPSVQKSMAHQKYAYFAAGGLLIALALFAVVSLWRAFKGSRPPVPSATRPLHTLGGPARRGK